MRLLRDSYVHQFNSTSRLRDTTARLRELGYEVVDVDGYGWHTDLDFHHAIAGALDFPAHYGHNLDAFNDCLAEVATGERTTGLVLVLLHFDRYARRRPESAQTILDIFASAARHASLAGVRLLCLVHSDEDELRFEPVGAQPVIRH